MSRVSLKDEEPISTNLLLTPDGVSQKSGGKKRPPLLKRLSASSLRTITNRDTTNADDTHGQAGVNNTVETRLEERSSTPSKSEFFSHQRKHSNTISGEMRPLSVETRIPSPPRRSSDGSPRQSLYPTTINISAPTPTTATFSKEVFSTATTGLTFELLQSQDNISYPEHREHDLGNRDRPPTPIAPPEESQEPYNSVVSSPTTLGPILGQRARGISTSTMSSTTSLGSIGPDLSRSSSTPTSKLATSGRPSRRRESLDTAVSSEGGFSTAAGSIATACGLEVANTKRNAEFHALFRSVPEDDLLIEDYGCALQKEILVQGRIYISEHHICFNANIFGWVTNLVLAFSEVVSIEKKMTAMFIPNGIQICTLHAKHSFASFLSRDMAYDQMFDVWRVAHPSNPLSSTLKAQVGETISDNDDDSLVDADDSSYTGSEESDDDDEYPRTEPSQVDALGIARKSSPTESDKSVEPSEEELARRRALSDVGPRPNMIAVAAANKATPSLSVPPMTVLPKTECQCAHSGGHGHYPNVALDATFPGSIAALYNLLFNSSFIADFLKDGEKSQDINIGDWIKESDSKESVRKSTYIKYLGMAIGPKSTKCHLEERCLSCDLNKNVTVLTTTQTPDVPMGTSFSVKTRACITSAGGGKVQLLVTFQVEFTKGGLLKSTIEKASSDGQITYYKNLEAAIKSYISTHPSEFGQMRKKRRDKKSGKIRKSRSETDKDTQAIELKKSLNRPENESQASVYRVVEDIISGMATTSANILRFIIKHVGIPSSAQITFFFFGLLVFTNVFLLRKMSIVDKQLADLSYSRLHSVEGGMTVVNLEQEREMLWNWLKSRDQGKSKLKTSLEKQWNAQTQQTLRQKALLDQQLVGIQAIIRSTEEQLDTMRSSSYKKHQ